MRVQPIDLLVVLPALLQTLFRFTLRVIAARGRDVVEDFCKSKITTIRVATVAKVARRGYHRNVYQEQ